MQIRHIARRVLLAAALLPVTLPVLAQDGLAAHFYFYRPVAGKQQAFEQGYRRHLGWHRQHRDPLVWYGWMIEDGPRSGQFVDASVGEPFAAFDRRVDLAGDAADAARNVLPFVTPQAQPTYVLRPQLGTGTPLEDHRPSATMQVTVFHLRPGNEARFEHAALAARRALTAQAGAPVHTWYRLVAGGRWPVARRRSTFCWSRAGPGPTTTASKRSSPACWPATRGRRRTMSRPFARWTSKRGATVRN